MDGWQIAFVSVALPAAITAVLKFVADRGRTRADAYMADAKIGAELRDELRSENSALRKRMEALADKLDEVAANERLCREDRDRMRAEIQTMRGQITRLEGQVRGYQDRRGTA